MRLHEILLLLLLSLLPTPPLVGQLVVNVRLNWPTHNLNADDLYDAGEDNDSGGAGFLRQWINGNTSTNTVSLQYTEADGTVITQLTDFTMMSQIVRILIPGEEELQQPRYQALCFISFYTGDLIPPEAVMKLRQKHPGTIRVPDEDLGEIVQDSPLALKFDQASSVSSHLSSFCRDARRQSFTSQHELFSILSSSMASSGKPSVDGRPSQRDLQRVGQVAVEGQESLPRCFTLSQRPDLITPCICSRRVWFYWFPCALKYCRNKDNDGEHRCGIKTCKKCMTFRYPVPSEKYCSWDEA